MLACVERARHKDPDSAFASSRRPDVGVERARAADGAVAAALNLSTSQHETSLISGSMPIHLRRRQGRAMRAQGRCLLLHADEGRCSLVLRRLPARFGRARSHSSGTRFAAGCFPVGRSTRPRGIQADVRQMVTRAAAGCLISPSLPARQPPANIARTVRDRRACGVGRDHACPFGRGALRSAGCAPSSMDCACMFVVLSLRRPRALLLYGRDSIPSDATDGLDRRPASAGG